jgi:DNA-binding beta-propeller fold protein YncE/mono/diheme cytochrome c family protein
LAAALALLSVTRSYAAAYRSPINVTFSPDGSLLAAADPTWGGVVIIDPQSRSVLREVALKGDPSYVIWNGNDKVLVSEGSAGTVAEVNATSGELIRRLSAVRRATGLAGTSDGKLMLVCDRGLNRVAFVDLDKFEVTKTVDVVREPGYIALTGDDQYAVVSNKLPPSEDARTKEHGAQVSIIEVSTGNVRNVKLPGGASIVRQVAISPDNRWAYVTHQIGRANSMVTQVDRGWTMTNGTTIIDIAKAEHYASFLYDRDGAGAANPWGLAVSPDGSKLWATLAGNSELAVVDLKGLHGLLADDDVTRANLYNDIGTMSGKELLTRRILSDVEGTRGIAVNRDGTLLAVASYFEGKVLLVDLAGDYLPSDETASVRTQAVVLNNNPAEDQTRMGERLFNGAKYCNQHWLSCATCHEGGRMDSLNWDLMNDGQGNPKNTKSHVLSAVTPPTNITGCRENAHVSARAGYLNIEFTTAATEDIVSATYAYMESLAAEPSPYLGPDWKLTPDAVEGKKIFESQEADCSRCHGAPLFTDLTRWDVGTRLKPPDISTWDDGGYDTPTLVEVWRTAPYLHLGHAITLKDVLTTFNKDDKHGKTSHLSSQQLDQLVAYLMQIGPGEDEVVSKADAGPPTPVEPDPPAGGCICRMGSIGGGAASASAYRTIVVGMTMLLLTAWRRRRVLRSHAPKAMNAQRHSLKG